LIENKADNARKKRACIVMFIHV